MKYQEALIAWTPGTDQIRVGHLIQRNDEMDWTDHPVQYACTGGAAYSRLRNCTDKTTRDLMLFIEFHSIVVRDKVPIDAAHQAFLAIDEYRQRIAPDIDGSENEDASFSGW